MELHANVVPEEVVLPGGAERALEARGIDERVLAALAVAELIHEEDHAARPRPENAHVLELALRFGIVMAVDDQDPRHRSAHGIGDVEVRGDEESGTALVDEVLDLVARA